MIGMRESDFCSVGPLNRLWSPIVLIIINISPFRLCTATVFLDSGRHMNSVLLFQLFICQMLRRRWLDSYSKNRVVSFETQSLQ